MRKIFAIGVLFLALALVIGLTWIGPSTSSTQTGSGTVTDYRVDKPNGTTVNVNLTAEETTQEIAPAIKYHVWTFDGTTPAPVIRVHLGDTVHFTLTNNSSIGMQHSIDFHAAMTPWADLPAAGQTTLTGNYQPVNPGETKTFDWVAMFPGVFMYHCGVPPVLQHISNGMYGAIIVEPDNLPKEREYVLVSSEFYPGKHPVNGIYEGDLTRMEAAKPTYVVFNGKADQYKTAPLVVKPNEPFRIWVLNAGPTLDDAFHVIGTMFDQTHPDGNPANTLYGLQTYNIAPGAGAMFELRIPDAGLYPFVTHAFAYTGLGAVGLIKVDPNAPAAPTTYPLMADSFSAGVTPFQMGGGTTPTPTVTPTASTPTPTATATATATATPGGGAPCSPSGTKLSISAQNVAFSTNCLAAPADRAFTIAFDNMDAGIPHNVAIFTDSSASKSLFVGALVTGPKTTTYKVKGLPAGTYFFRCDVHPTTMNGTFVVG